MAFQICSDLTATPGTHSDFSFYCLYSYDSQQPQHSSPNLPLINTFSIIILEGIAHQIYIFPHCDIHTHVYIYAYRQH